jgi:hypothetical protein
MPVVPNVLRVLVSLWMLVWFCANVNAQTAVSEAMQTSGGGSTSSNSFNIIGSLQHFSHNALPTSSSFSITPAALGSSASDTEAPSTPQITNTDYGNEEIYLTVADSGSSPITSYTATCTDGTAQYTGNSSTARITVSGLTNGVGYSCSVTSTNAAGTSKASASSPPIVPEYIPVGLPIWLLYEASKPASP